MTDLPRRSYPLVVAPPSGFEDAVRRGRNVRRRRVGGSSAVALVLAGALGWSVLGGGGDVTRLDQANETDATPTARAMPPGGQDRVVPTALPTQIVEGPRPSSTSSPGTGSNVRPSADPSRHVGVAPREPGTRPPGARYAPRNPIERSSPMTDPASCLTQSPDTQWCASAYVTESGEFEYELNYTLCRSVNAETGMATFDWKQQVDFATTDKANTDTVWTYSKGVGKVESFDSLTIGRGTCYTWSTVWNGFDDFGYTPPAGTYVLTARPLARETELPAAQIEFTHR